MISEDNMYVHTHVVKSRLDESTRNRLEALSHPPFLIRPYNADVSNWNFCHSIPLW